MGAKSKVLENSFLYTFSSLLVKAMGFFLLPIYTMFLTPEDYGIINLANGFIQVATFIIAFSLYSAVTRFYVDYKEDLEKLKRFYGTVITFVFLSGVFALCIGLILRHILFSTFFEEFIFYPVILVSLLTLIFISLHSVHQNIMQGMQQGKKLTTVNLIVFFLQVCLNLFFISLIKLGALGVLLANLIINISYFLYMIIDLKKNNLVTFCLDRSLLINALKYSIPLMPHNLSTHIASFAARVFINTSGTLSLVGLYSIASQFGSLIDTVQSSVYHAFAPWFYETMNSTNKEKRKEIINLSNFLLIIYSVIYLIIGLFSQEFIMLMTNKNYETAWTVVPILVAAFTFKSIYYFYINILFYYKDASKKIFLATLTGSFADIIFSYFMIPKYGMYGAAFAFLIAKMVVTAIVVIISKSYDDIGYKLSYMLKIIICSLMFMVVGLYFSYSKYINVYSLFNFNYKLMVLFSYFICVFIANKKIIVNNLNNKEFKRILKINKLKEIENLKICIISFFIKSYMFLMNKIFNVKKNKVVFKSFGGKSYSDNPKAISEKLKLQYPEAEIVWLINEPFTKMLVIPYYVKVVKSKSFKALKELATAKIWVDNFCKNYVYKSKNQIYIQTWHGDRGFKKILLDSPFVNSNYKLIESNNCDLMIAGSDYGEKKYRTAFAYNGEILKVGCPRNDFLVKNRNAKKFIIKSNLNLIYNTKVLLYAPTLRRDSENKFQSSKDIDILSILNLLQLKTGCRWICMFRAHSAVKGLYGIPKNEKKIIDVTHYEDMTELLLISDFLITDYSSCAGDFALLNKPIILFQPDREEYVQNDRTFYFDIDSSPFMIAKSNEEILKLIMNFEQEIIQQNCKDLLNFYGATESGEASERVVEYIISKINSTK